MGHAPPVAARIGTASHQPRRHRQMQIGIQIPDFTTPNGPSVLGSDLAIVARAAEEQGFEYLAVMDHFFQIGAVGPSEHEMLEAYTLLGYLAAQTSRVQLLTVITAVIYRYP